MTHDVHDEPAESIATAALPEPVIMHSSESQWSLIWREFRKRKAALFSLGVILLLITISVCAPLLANGKPFRYLGFNRFEYREATRTLLAVMNLAMEPRKADAEKLEGVEDHDVILARQFDLMKQELRDDAAEKLAAVEEKVLSLTRTLQEATAAPPAETVAEMKKLRIEIRSQFDSSKAPLTSRTHWPVFDSLGWNDIALLVFNVMLLALPFWRRLLSQWIPPESSRRSWATAFSLAGVPLLAAGLWMLMMPERLDRTPYMLGVSADDPKAGTAPVVYEEVSWPPVPYSLDEGNLDSKYARPGLLRYFPPWMLGIWTELPPEAPQGVNVVSQKADSPPPGLEKPVHWMGTDGTGRDILSRMIWGGRVSLSVGIVATAIELALGITLGALAGYFRGWVDVVISRVIEIVICFPSFFLILTIVAFLGPSIYNIMLVIGLTGWTGLARLVRGEFLKLSGQEFVLSARALGYKPARIIFRHVLPNAMAPVLVTTTFAIAGAILTESALSFLNLGITEPTPSWGGILYTGREAIIGAPWIIFFPGLAVFITITTYNLVGEAFQDAADPRLRGRM